jgi:2-hydroxycyclohexanecarboxyl-CoA dehydrogenase
MKGKVAVVTGGSRGIGFAAALRFLREGAHVAVADVRDVSMEHLQLVGQKAGTRLLFVKTDVGWFSEVQAMGKKVQADLGRIDIWVNNAGWDRITPFLSTGPEDWAKVVGVNLMGVVHGTRVALEAMVARKEGGRITFTKAIAREVAQYGIRVNCVCPGPTETPLLEENFGTEDRTRPPTSPGRY